MKATIRTERFRKTSSFASSRKSVVHVTSPLSSLIDGWFSKNQVWGLNFKCSTWTSLRNKTIKRESQAIAQALGVNPKNIKWSGKAGCSCGCSPGFVIRNEPTVHSKDIWMDIVDCEQDLSEFQAMIPTYDKKLEKEIAEKSAVAV